MICWLFLPCALYYVHSHFFKISRSCYIKSQLRQLSECPNAFGIRQFVLPKALEKHSEPELDSYTVSVPNRNYCTAAIIKNLYQAWQHCMRMFTSVTSLMIFLWYLSFSILIPMVKTSGSCCLFLVVCVLLDCEMPCVWVYLKQKGA